MQPNTQLIALLSASSAFLSFHTATASKCSAIGYLNTNSVYGGGDQTPTDVATNGVRIYKDGNQIGKYDVCDQCKPVCSDIISIDSELPVTFGWAASCGVNTFNECHGSYGSQTHIDGEPPQEGNDFYGLGISTNAQCKIDFDC